jgi:hypothetical protein
MRKTHFLISRFSRTWSKILPILCNHITLCHTYEFSAMYPSFGQINVIRYITFFLLLFFHLHVSLASFLLRIKILLSKTKYMFCKTLMTSKSFTPSIDSLPGSNCYDLLSMSACLNLSTSCPFSELFNRTLQNLNDCTLETQTLSLSFFAHIAQWRCLVETTCT